MALLHPFLADKRHCVYIIVGRNNKMRVSIIIFIIFTSIKSFAQLEHIDQTELYKSLKITEMIITYHDSTFSEPDSRTVFDSFGRMVYSELLPKDSIPHGEYWYYKDSLLISKMMVGVWQTNPRKTDTLTTDFVYNDSNQVVSEEIFHTHKNNYQVVNYSYEKSVLSSKTKFNPKQTWWYETDSIEYYSSGIIRKSSHYKYYNGYIEFSSQYFYNETGRLEFYVRSDNFDIYELVTFIYNDESLIRIKQINMYESLDSDVNTYTKEKLFEYDSRGLLVKVTELWDGVLDCSYSIEYKTAPNKK